MTEQAALHPVVMLSFEGNVNFCAKFRMQFYAGRMEEEALIKGWQFDAWMFDYWKVAAGLKWGLVFIGLNVCGGLNLTIPMSIRTNAIIIDCFEVIQL